MGKAKKGEKDLGVREMLEFLSAHAPRGARAATEEGEVLWSPPADVYEVDGTLFVLLEIGGMKSSEFQIRVEGTALTVRGERHAPHHGKDRRYHCLEWRSGPFEKRILLPAGFDHARPGSRYVDGVLEISFPACSGGAKR